MTDIQDTIVSQYLAALDMLKQAVAKCPPDLWEAPAKNRFWHTAYHVLFYTHLYLQTREEDFVPWDKHNPAVTSLEPEDDLDAITPYTQEEVLEYLDFCQQQVKDLVPNLDFKAESGFHWLPFNKLELQFYNIRHIQQHTGELYQQLLEESINVGWVGMRPTST